MFNVTTFFLATIMIGCSAFPMKYHWRHIQSSSSRWMVTQKVLQEKVSIEQRVVSLMKKINIPSTSTLLLSVSGGSDSMAMLHILRSIQNQYLTDLSLKVVNFNHKARKESDEEAEFVRKWCDKYNIEFFLCEFPEDLREASNFQSAARHWRRTESRRILESLRLSKDQSKYIVTAHHLEDQMETLLLKLLRGAFIANLQPMSYIDGLYLRPFLDFRKDELRKYLEDYHLDWREDITNQQRIYRRNKIRLDLIPLLTELTGSSNALSNRLLALGRQSQDLSDFLDHQILDYQKYFTCYQSLDTYVLQYSEDIVQVPRFVLGQIIHRWIEKYTKYSVDNKQLQGLISLIEKKFDGRKILSQWISEDYSLEAVIGKELRLIRNRLINVSESELSDTILFEDKTNRVSLIGDEKDFKITRESSLMTVSCTFQVPADSKYELRFCRDGDRFSKPSKLLVDALRRFKVPVHERSRTIGLFVRDDVTATDVAVMIFIPTKTITGDYQLLLEDTNYSTENKVNYVLHWLSAPVKVNVL